ncbi:hypothetical protein BD410DRAFT_758063 [Rickenella mellea]|uniref:TOG domain-containing protein n=1 Tax=Rickenella mellea TaxID=50990 RepID=A0A4R5XE08_9AGAM|nr:hypothetical protein BD410DRAFT_758063 [Rickenella mellea]
MDHIDRLIAQCKSADVDIKIDAITKLHHEFEAGTELPDIDELISVLKSSLRTSNQHLATATVSALPSFFPLAIGGSHDAPAASLNIPTLRHVLTAFLPSGGLVDRLGDNRERVRDKARESLVVLGGLAFRSGGTSPHASLKSKEAAKGQESPLMLWERFVREAGLQSKVWRVREQSILTLVHVRRVNRSFPIRPYLPHLVEALEDTDGTVRDCARQSVVELFTGPGVTDAARADLKKEMTRKGVRKTIVDSVVGKLLPGSGEQVGGLQNEPSESESSKKEYIPPSMALQNRRPTASLGSGISRTFSQSTSTSQISQSENTSRPASRMGNEIPPTPTAESVEVPSVFIASSKDLENEFSQMLKYFEGKETEHNWLNREKSVIKIRGMLKGDVHVRYADAFLAGLKNGVLEATLKSLASLRTTVSAQTCSLYFDLATSLGTNLDPFSETLLTHLLRMAGFTKKIVATQSQSVVNTIITVTSAQPKMVLNLLWNTLQEKTPQARTFALNHYKTYLEVHGQRSKHAIEATGSLDVLEKGMRKGLADPNAAVREVARVTFWSFETIWKDKGAAIINSLDATARKQLEKACPDPQAAAIIPVATPKPKKSSIAAAIAASRAKAKTIATAPPTLRHQATSTSHAVNAATTSPGGANRPTSPGFSSKSSPVLRSSPPQTRPLSPGSPPRRVSSLSPQRRPVSGLPIAHSRSHSSELHSSPPSSPSIGVAARRSSSFQANLSTSPGNTLRTAAQIALPASPPLGRGVPAPPSRRIVLKRPVTVPALITQNRTSIVNLDAAADGEPSLLLAAMVPIPDGSESDEEDGNLMLSFSDAFEKSHPNHLTRHGTKATLSGSSTGSPPPLDVPQPIIEDALRARAEQAESAAERLLELVEPDDDMLVSLIPPSLIRSNGSAMKPSTSLRGLNGTSTAPPSTPANKSSSIMRQAALFKDSPAYNGSSLLLDTLQERKHTTVWWLKRMTLIEKGTPLKTSDVAAKVQEINAFLTALEQGQANVELLKNLTLLCLGNPFHDAPSPLSPTFTFPPTPSPMSGNDQMLSTPLWTEGRLFDRLFGALTRYLEPDRNEEELEYGLMVVWQMLDSQGSLLEGHESDIFSLLLRIRYCNQLNVLEATNTIRDTLAARVEPVYGLTTMHSSIRSFLSEPIPAVGNADIKAASYAFGLLALGKFILRLPGEVLEEELPRLKGTLTTALNDSSSLVVRESAATSIIASQLVLRDETHLFTLLDGLADEKKNLLTYLFDKHGARGQPNLSAMTGAEKLEREMRRLDGRTNTPPRPKLA